MNRSTITAIAAAVSLAFSACAMANSMTKEEYKAGKKSIESEYTTTKATCVPLLANAKDICNAEAKGKESVALAELQAAFKPSAKTRYEVRIAKADADFAVAKEKCDDLAGNAKDVCMKEAKAARIAAKADAKTQLKTADVNKAAHKEVVEARKDAAADKRAAEYSVAKEKCEALKGDANEQCKKEAKSLYGKL